MQPEKLPLTSLSIKDEQMDKLRSLFPEVLTEGGKIDFEKLKLTLGESIDMGKERYGMSWPGKADCFKVIQATSRATLLPCPEESLKADGTAYGPEEGFTSEIENDDFDDFLKKGHSDHLFIEGDNLEVLKLLQKSYLNKVKMIYIDPPYNTGKEFVYSDNFNDNLQNYLEYTGQVDGDGKKLSTNTETDGRYHSNWLNMMYPRLFLAKNLLREDGVIFISIDDNEQANLKKLCDEIFGEENFVANLIWKSRQIVDSRNKTKISNDHEYILIYAKNIELINLTGKEILLSKYTNPDNDERGPWMSNSILGLANKSQRPNLHYDLVDPETGNVYTCPPDTGWRYSKETMNYKIKDKRLFFPSKIEGRPREKKFLNEITDNTTGFSTLLDSKVGFTLNGTRQVRDIFGDKYFDFPKPSSLIIEFLKQSVFDSEVILDFFAGSATTAHAVLDLNKEDKSNRKYILVQLPEATDENSEAHKAGFKTIAEISKERIRRVSTKLKNEITEEKQKVKTGDLFAEEEKSEKNPLDIGFRAFKLAPSNFKAWDTTIDKKPETIQATLDLYIDHVDESKGQEALLFELLLKSGFPLNTSIQTLTIDDKKVYSIENHTLLISLEPSISHELIQGMAELQPTRVICLDEGFLNNDQLKVNAVKIMESKGVERFFTV